jgi:hypothetical protein
MLAGEQIDPDDDLSLLKTGWISGLLDLRPDAVSLLRRSW